MTRYCLTLMRLFTDTREGARFLELVWGACLTALCLGGIWFNRADASLDSQGRTEVRRRDSFGSVPFVRDDDTKDSSVKLPWMRSTLHDNGGTTPRRGKPAHTLRSEIIASKCDSLWSALTTDASVESQQKEKYLLLKGRYYNYDYGYSVLIPAGLTGFRAAAPAPNHGFGITLSEKPESSVWVDASYNAADWKSFDDAISSYISGIKDSGGMDVSVEQRTPAWLENCVRCGLC
jgi:hypothetical protein